MSEKVKLLLTKFNNEFEVLLVTTFFLELTSNITS